MIKANNIVRITAKYIISFLLSLALIVLVTTVLLKTTVLRESYIKDFLKKTDYYNKAYENINEDFKKYTLQSGFGDSIVDNICNKEMVKADIDSVIEYVYNNKELKIQTNEVVQKLENNIQRHIEEKGYKVTEETKKSIEVFKVAIVNTYKNDIIYVENAVQILNTIIQTLRGMVLPIMLVAIILATFFILMLYKMEKREALKYILIAVITTIILCVTIKVGFEKYINIEKSIYFIMQGV